MNKREVFLVEYQGKNVIFAPLKGIILEVRDDEKNEVDELLRHPEFSFEDLLGVFPEIKKDRLMSQKTEDESEKEKIREFCPTSAILFPTFNCHLRCIYCYSEAGEQKVNMSWEVAKAAIDFIVENTKQNKEKECSLEFHGGGEPTWNWPVFQSSLSYFQERTRMNGLVPKVNLVTNGMLSEMQIDWIVKHNLRTVQVSLDGMEEIHDSQRPTAGGGKSFAIVYRAINSFLTKGAEVVIHSVVTEIGVKRIPEIVCFFGKNFPGLTVQIEPACPCGRGLATGQQFPSPEIFAKGFIESLDIAKSFGINLIYSGVSSRLTEIHRSFCGASEPNFVVTPEGFITACHEVAELNHPFANLFIYGQWDKVRRKFLVDNQKIEHLRNTAIEGNSLCRDCFAQFYCAGDCSVKNLTDKIEKDILSPNSRCRINRELTKYYIFSHLFGGEKGGAQ